MLSTENLLLQAQEIAQKNRKKMIKGNHDPSTVQLHVIETQGFAVFDPFFDVTMRFEVDPIREYGEEVIRRFVESYHNRNQ